MLKQNTAKKASFIITKQNLIFLSIFILAASIRIIIFTNTENYFLKWEDIPASNIVGAKFSSFSDIFAFTLPLHPLLIKIGLLIYNNTLFTPRLITLIFGIFLHIPFFILVKNYFNKENAYFSTIILSFYPLAIIQSILSTEIIIFSFFLYISLIFIQSHLQTGKKLPLLLSAIFFNLAHMTRMESWLLSGFIVTYLFFKKKIKSTFFFSILGNIFIFYSFINHTPLEYIQQHISVSHFEINLLRNVGSLQFSKVNDIFSWIRILTQTLTIPFTILAFLGIILSLIKKQHLFLLSLFGTILTTYTYKLLLETVQPHPRYSLLMGILIIPFPFYFFQNILKNNNYRKYLISLFSIFIITLFINLETHIYGEKIPSVRKAASSSIQLPLLTQELLLWIKNSVNEHDLLFLDQPKNAINFLNVAAYTNHETANLIVWREERPFQKKQEYIDNQKEVLTEIMLTKKPKYLIMFRDGCFNFLLPKFKTTGNIMHLNYKQILNRSQYMIYKLL